MRLIVVLLLLCSALPARAAAVLDQIRASGVLRVGTTGDYKPFSFRNPDGSYVGADIDMAQSLAAKLGVRVEIVPTAWGQMMADFTAGRFDIAMGGITNLPARATKGMFAHTIYVDGKRPIVRCADRDTYVSVDAINQPQVRVIVNPGATNEEFARANFPKAQLTIFPDNVTVFGEIAANRADVMVTDGIEVDHQSSLHHELCPAHVAAPFTRLEKAYWMQPDADLLALVNAWEDGEIAGGGWKQKLDKALASP